MIANLALFFFFLAALLAAVPVNKLFVIVCLAIAVILQAVHTFMGARVP